MCKQQHQRHREVQRAEGMLPFLVAKSGWEEIPQHRDASHWSLTAVEVSEAAALSVGTPCACWGRRAPALQLPSRDIASCSG